MKSCDVCKWALGVYLLLGGLVLINFLQAPPDGLANVGIALYVFPVTLLGKVLGFEFPPFVPKGLGYYGSHVAFFIPSLFAQAFFLRWACRKIFCRAQGRALLLLAGLLFPLGQAARAGRPVFHDVNLPELVESSGLIFSGWPSTQPPVKPCAAEMRRWQVHQVLRGDQSLQGKVISVAAHGYGFHHEKPVPSYSASRFGDGAISFEQSTSILFLNPRSDGCFEWAAQGAQLPESRASVVKALLNNSASCESQLESLEDVFRFFPSDCQTDQDCKIFYSHPNSCAAPMLWSQRAETELAKPEMASIIGSVRSRCAAQWGKQPACAPQVFPFRCRQKRCERGIPEGTLVSFSEAKAALGCAPHDAASVIVQVLPKKGEYPQLSVNWWGADRPRKPTGSYRLVDGNVGNGEKPGYSASFCSSRGGCESLKSVDLSLDWPKEGKPGTLRFTVFTQSGDRYTDTVPLNWEKGSGMPCG